MSTLASELSPAEPDGGDGGPVAALIRARAVTLGDKPYLEHARTERTLTFSGLAHAVEQWSIRLEKAGVAPGSTVGLVIGDPIGFSVAFLGTIASGCWAAALDPSTPVLGAGGLIAAIGRVRAGVVVADRPLPDGVELPWVELGPEFSVSAPAADPAMRAATGRTSGGAILASSGTTGVPKVIPLHQAQLLHTARSVSDHHGLTAADRGFNSLPLFHINAEVVGLLTSLVAGSTLVLDDRFHRTQFWDLMTERGITWINAVPAIISRLADPGPGETVPSHIRFIRSASAPLPVATSARFEANTGIPVVETYGMTEAASQITANPVAGPRKPGSVGLPVGVELRLVAAGGHDGSAGADNVGHVEIRGPSVITAYGGGHHADRIDAEGWLQTGDLGHFDEDGYLYLDARTDDVINRGGEKVFPREIEEMVLVDGDVAAVAVVAAPDPELGQVPVAFVVLHGVDDDSGRDKAAETVDRIRDRLGAALVKSKRPVLISVVRELPAGATGKVQRRTLRESGIDVLYQLDCR
jgi:acyl-CoA synthetase (AMP-forming)/AMP-acid ligase II